MRASIFIVCGLVLQLTASTFGYAKGRADVELFVHDPLRIHRDYIASLKEVSLDHPNREGYEAYGPPSLAAQLDARGISYWNIRMNAKDNMGYPTFRDIESTLKNLAARFPEIMRLSSIGKSSSGRDLWVMKISDNPAADEVEPEVKYISSMHGNEITGRELMVRLIEEIGTRYEAGDPTIRSLVDNREIYVMPSMNPDGSELRQRANGRGVDLNRDFPDFSSRTDNQNTPNGRAVETQAIMAFQAARQFALSANFHGGSEVVNYPWDTVADLHPFDALVRELSLGYALRAPYIHQSQEFEEGITNGYAWYEVEGGMQDWSYYWHNDLQVTIELSNEKWPAYREIANFYQQNRDALLYYLGVVEQGAGFTLSQPNLSGRVAVQAILADGTLADRGTYSFHNSEFYKVLALGRYRFSVTMPGRAEALVFDTEVGATSAAANGNYQHLVL